MVNQTRKPTTEPSNNYSFEDLKVNYLLSISGKNRYVLFKPSAFAQFDQDLHKECFGTLLSNKCTTKTNEPCHEKTNILVSDRV